MSERYRDKIVKLIGSYIRFAISSKFSDNRKKCFLTRLGQITKADNVCSYPHPKSEYNLETIC